MKLLLAIISIFYLTPDLLSQQQYENLVFEGAGIKGLAYSGVIEQLEIYGVVREIEKVGGTSAGAITALMVALDYSSDEIFRIVSSTRFQKFNSGGGWFVGGIYRMNNRFGWYKNNNFEKWLEEIIVAKTGNPEITFSELTENGFKELYVTGTCLNRQEMILFSAETYPSMKIKDAVKVSMSIPLYFEANFIDKDGELYKNPDDREDLDIVVDGGILGNFPIEMFDETGVDSMGSRYRIPDKKTLGIRIDSDRQIENDRKRTGLVEQDITDLKSYIEAFYILTLESLNRHQLTNEDWERTISVSSVGIGPRIKRLKDEDKERLRKSGIDAVIQFFEQNHQGFSPAFQPRE